MHYNYTFFGSSFRIVHVRRLEAQQSIGKIFLKIIDIVFLALYCKKNSNCLNFKIGYVPMFSYEALLKLLCCLKMARPSSPFEFSVLFMNNIRVFSSSEIPNF